MNSGIRSAVTLVLLCIATPAAAVDVSLDIATVNPTSVNDVAYRLGGVTVNTTGAAAQTPVTLSVTGLGEGQQTLFTTFGPLTIDVAANGDVTKVDGPFTIVDSDLTIQNTVDLGTGTLTIVAENPSAYDTLSYQMRDQEESESDVGATIVIAGTPATPAVFPFTGMAPNMDFLVFTSFDTIGFRIDGAGQLDYGTATFPGSDVPGEVYTITGPATITLENDFGFPTLTVNAEQATAVNEFGAFIADIAFGSSDVGPTAPIPGDQAPSGVTLPFNGLTRYAEFRLVTTVGQMHLRLDENGDITFGNSTIPGSGSDLLFSASGSTITLKNRLGYPEVRFAAAAPTSASELDFILRSFSGVYSPNTEIGSQQTIPGSQALDGVTYPFYGMLPYSRFQASSDFGSPIFRLEEDNSFVLINAPAEELVFSGNTITWDNTVNYELAVMLDQPIATDFAYLLNTTFSNNLEPERTLPAGLTAEPTRPELLGIVELQSVQFASDLPNFFFAKQQDGTFNFGAPATNVSPTMGALFFDGGANNVFLEILPLAPRVASTTPDANALGVPPSTAVTVSFTEPVDPLTVDGSSFRLLDPNGVPIPSAVTLSPSGLTAVLDPTLALALDGVHTIDLGATILDLEGNPLDPFQSPFRTTGSAASGVELDDPGVATSTGSPPAPTDARAGTAIAGAGDLDGNGIADLIAGAPGYVVGANAEAGAAIVFLGSTDAGERASPDIIFTGVGAHDRAGTSVAGDFDFDGDGTPDLLIGAEQVDRTLAMPSPTGTGLAYLIYFDPSDYPNLTDPLNADTIDLARVGNPSHPEGEIPGVVFTGATVDDQAGFSVAAGGQLNDGPGVELAIGAPGRDIGAAAAAGTVYVIFDQPLASGTVDLGQVANGLGDQVDGIVYEGGFMGDALGFSVAFVGDVVGDANEDLAMGAPMADPIIDAIEITDAGIVYIAAGGDVVSGIIEVCPIGQTIDGAQILGDQQGEQLGYAVAAGGDNLTDGQDDLLIGAPFHDYDPDDGGPLPLRVDAGRVVHTASKLNAGIIEVCEIGGGPTAGVIWLGAADGDGLGTSIASLGDVTGNGFDDVLLGAPFADVDLGGGSPVLDAGVAYLIEGGTQNVNLGIIEVCPIGETIPGIQYTGTQENENVGAAVAGVGDFSGSGTDDFAIGAPGSEGDGAEEEAGTVYVVLEVTPPPPGVCGPGGCTVADLTNGARLFVPDNTLEIETTLAVTGITAPADLPGPPPAGFSLVAAAAFDADGQTFTGATTADLPIRQAVETQIAPGETFDIFFWDGGAWVDSTLDGNETGNFFFGLRKVVQLTPTILRTYAAFFADGDGDDARDGQDNCPGRFNPAQSDVDGDGAGDLCDACPAENPNDADGDGLCCPADNCCTVSNVSQADADVDGIGDACDVNAVLRVSSDGADNPDFFTVQGAADVALPGTRIEVLPGLGPYLENVTLTRPVPIRIAGSGTPVVIDGGGGTAIDVAPVVPETILSDLTLRGATGARASAATSLDGLTLESITGVGLDLDAGAHEATAIGMDATVAAGIELASGAILELGRSRLGGIPGTALAVGGSATVETTLITGAGACVVLDRSGASLSLGYSTLADCTGAGIDATAGGTATIVHGLLWNNGGGDLVGVPCTAASWSNIGAPDCSSVNDNLSAAPQFVGSGDYRLMPASPLLDQGPDPSLFTGEPCEDLDGNPRLRDADGDGLARLDPGAYELGLTPVPGPVTGLTWTGPDTLGWDVEAAAVEYHVYRGTLAELSYAGFGTCRDDLDALRTDTALTDTEDPAPGEVFFYGINAEGAGNAQGSLGLASCAERSNFTPCP